MFQNPFESTKILVGQKEVLHHNDLEDDEVEEVGVDIADALDVLSVSGFDSASGRDDLESEASSSSIPQPETSDKVASFERNSDRKRELFRHLKSFKTKSVSQSSSGVFSTVSTSKVPAKFRGIKEKVRGKLRHSRLVALPPIGKPSSKLSPQRRRRLEQQFASELAKFAQEPISRSVLRPYQDEWDNRFRSHHKILKNQEIFHSLEARLHLQQEFQQFFSVTVYLTKSKIIAVEGGELRCDILIDDVKRIQIDEHREIGDLVLQNGSIVAFKYFEGLNQLLMKVEYFVRVKRGCAFAPIFEKIGFVREFAFLTVCDTVEFYNYDQNVPDSGNVEIHAMYQELDDVLEANDLDKSWKPGHFLIK